MNIKTLNNRKGSVTVETAIVFPLLLILIALFAVVIKDNIHRSVVNHLAVNHSIKECCGMTVNQFRVDISNGELEWLSGKDIGTEAAVIDNILMVTAESNMNINIPVIGKKKKTNKSKIYVPVFNDIFGDNSNGEGETVWDLLPFDRGKIIENVFGNNMPDKFEVLDILTEEGLGISIVSIDIMSATYADDQVLYNKIVEHIDKLNCFQGGEAGSVRVDAGHVKEKKLIVIIPSNGMTDQQQVVFQNAEMYAVTKNIKMEVIEYQEKSIG